MKSSYNNFFKTNKIMSPQDYWKANLKLLAILLFIWFVISFGFGIILSDFLDRFSLGGFKLGFWFAQQGVFMVLLSSSSFMFLPCIA